MSVHKCFLIGIVFALAVGLTSPHVSFACWFTGAENTVECCTVCCQDAEVCQDYLSGEKSLFQSGCSFNFYCLVNPVYCSRSCLEMDVCPFGLILEGDQSKLDALRKIRDTRLLKTDVGESLVGLFYQHAGEVTDILRADEDLLAIAANITDEIVERALEADSDGEMIIDPELVESAIEVMDLIDEEASPALSKTIKMVQREMKRKILFRKMGITID